MIKQFCYAGDAQLSSRVTIQRMLYEHEAHLTAGVIAASTMAVSNRQVRLLALRARMHPAPLLLLLMDHTEQLRPHLMVSQSFTTACY